MKTLITLICALSLFTLASNAQTTAASKTTAANPAVAVVPAPVAKPPVRKQRTNYIDKSNNAINGANNAVTAANGSVSNAGAAGTNAVNTAANAKSQAKNLSDQISNLVNPSKVSGATNTTQISVKGANFASLKKLGESIMACPGVQDVKMKFNAAESSITVTHAGTTEKLLKSIQKKSDQVPDDSIDNFDEGKIDLTLK